MRLLYSYWVETRYLPHEHCEKSKFVVRYAKYEKCAMKTRFAVRFPKKKKKKTKNDRVSFRAPARPPSLGSFGRFGVTARRCIATYAFRGGTD